MAQQSKHFDISTAIDLHLSNYNFDAVSLTSEHKYQPWYATLLSTVALLVADEEVIYAHSNYGVPKTDVRIVVFTNNLVVVADVDPNADVVPVARSVPRGSLVGMKLSASERIDTRDRRSNEWPGTLNLVLTYPRLPDSIEIVESGVNRYAADQSAPIVTLIEGLSADLAHSRAIG
ncbi:hypothetical protein [Cryobacterium aureum]|uniref:hypothetical protein n=1 Tax=Cryobacterium aureum TaxID=995037 RepID=UPI000CF47203|nr:hypothetical protein [Cryobacterium aureum]